MESVLLEKVNGGLLFLYGSGSKKEFCSNLELFLNELSGAVRFSILSVSESPGSFWVEHSTGMGLAHYDRLMVSSPVLAQMMVGGGKKSFEAGVVPDLQVGFARLPVCSARTLEFGEAKLGLMVGHDERGLVEAGDLGELEDYVIEQACTAYFHVCCRDQLAERLDCSDAKLEGIREISGLFGEFELGPLLSHLMSVYVRLTEAQVGSIVLEGGIAEDVEWGLSRSVLEELKFRDGRSLRKMAVETREPLLVIDYAGDERFQPIESCAIESVLCVPLVSKSCVLGTVNLVNSSSAKQGMFSERDKETVVTISSLAASAVENAVLHNDLIEKERIKANLQIARTIQQRMCPKTGVVIPGYEMAWVTRSCEETGGDYVDFLPLDDGRVALVVGDVSGHGIGAAMLMASGRANLRALLSVRSELKDVMDRLNDLLGVDMDEGQFMTLFLATLDPSTHRMTYVNAGHDLPLLFRARGGSCETLCSTGTPVGMLSGFSYEVGQVSPLEPGDVLLMTTDGVWETVSPGGERFGKGRLGLALARAATTGPKAILDAILADVERYTLGRSYADDLTLLVIKRTA